MRGHNHKKKSSSHRKVGLSQHSTERRVSAFVLFSPTRSFFYLVPSLPRVEVNMAVDLRKRLASFTSSRYLDNCTNPHKGFFHTGAFFFYF